MIRKYFLAQVGVLALVVSLVEVVQAYDNEFNLPIVSLSAGGSLPNGSMRMRYTRTGNRVRSVVQLYAGDGVNGTPFAAGVMADRLPSDIIPSSSYVSHIAGGEVTLAGINYVCYVDSRSIGIWLQASGDDRWYHSGQVAPSIECNYDVDD